MAIDYTEKERAFVASLQDDSGTGLAGWMRAIDLAKLEERNAIIDWLRQQGFTFANASWLERIHHNGGKLIYGVTGAALNLATGAPPPPEPMPRPKTDRGLGRGERLVPPASTTPLAALAQVQSPELAALLSAAKGLRPLAEVVLRDVQNAVPGVSVGGNGPFVMFRAPLPFAALLPAPKELRLFGDFGEAGGLVKRAETTQRLAPPFPQVAILNDARQVTAALMDLVRSAHKRANS